MPGRPILLLGILLYCLLDVAQTPATPAKPSPTAKSESAKSGQAAAELALDAAKRWTQAALVDSWNLQPVERDIFLVRLAHVWKDVDHARAEKYLEEGLDHLISDTTPDSTNSQDNSEFSRMIDWISSDVREIDGKTWEKLIEELPEREKTDAISSEALELAVSDDYAGALELTKKSLARGGSYSDISTLDAMTDDPASAAKLFDQIVSTAAKPQADPNLLTGLAQSVSSASGSPDTQSFFNEERQQRVLDLLAQLTLKGREAGGCSYTYVVRPLMSRFPPQLQGQLQSILTDCGEPAADVNEAPKKDPDSTDDLVRAMNETTSAQRKAGLRELAVIHAANTDHDYVRAAQLCLEASQEEQEHSGGTPHLFELWALNNASMAMRFAIEKQDVNGLQNLQNLLDILPRGMKASVELVGAGILSERDKLRARQMLDDARAILETELPVQPREYEDLLRETAILSPSDLSSAWTELVAGLNKFDQRSRDSTRNTGMHPVTGWNLNPWSLSTPWSIPSKAIIDENFVRASIEDVDSVKFREGLRIGIVSAFLSRYTELLKEPKQTSVVADAKK
jgi:hypothetical protein